jgi:rod shape determining protein RodA
MFSEPIFARQLSLNEKLGALNWPFLALVTAVSGVGVAALYSVSGGSFDPWAERQIYRFCFGMALLLMVALTDITVWMRAAFPLYVAALLMLVAVPVIGIETGGAKRWLGYGEWSFQPAELMKIALVLALARYYHWLGPRRISNPIALLLPLAMIAGPVALVIAQPDLGTAVLFAVVGVGLLFLAGVNWFYFLAGLIGVVSAVPFLWQRLHDYQKARILTFVDPDRDPLGAGYHILQSKIALGAGGISGKGFMQGTQSQLNFLPEKHTDFIFTMFAEEMGFIGAVVLLALYLLMMLFILYMTMRSKSTFGRLLASGIGITLFVYIFINVAMVMGLVPVVGVPLPLVSYGGTSMLTVMFGLGLVLNVHLHRNRLMSERTPGDV